MHTHTHTHTCTHTYTHSPHTCTHTYTHSPHTDTTHMHTHTLYTHYLWLHNAVNGLQLVVYLLNFHFPFSLTIIICKIWTVGECNRTETSPYLSCCSCCFLQQGGTYVDGSVCLSVCFLSIGNSRSKQSNCLNFFVWIGLGPRIKWFNFGSDPYLDAEPGIVLKDSSNLEHLGKYGSGLLGLAEDCALITPIVVVVVVVVVAIVVIVLWCDVVMMVVLLTVQ